MRKKRSANPIIEKSQEISRVQQINWVSAVVFGLVTPLYVLSAFATFDLFSVVLAVFFLVNFVISVRAILDLNRFKKNFMTSPAEYVGKAIRRPLLYRAVFWYLPK